MRDSCRRLAIGFLLFFWGKIFLIDIRLDGFNILPDFIGASLILLGSFYFINQHRVFGGLFKVLLALLPVIGSVLFVESVVGLIGFGSEIAWWEELTVWTERLFDFGLIGLGWKIASTYTPLLKKRWVISFVLASILVLISVASSVIDQVTTTIDLEVLKPDAGGLVVFAFFVIAVALCFIVYFFGTIWVARKELLRIASD